MAGLAQILKESGHDVSGADAKFYPPMSDYLKKIGIKTIEGYEKKSLPEADLYVIGNALSRGNECVEEILDQKLPYVSGPEMLGKELKNRNVFAISGTHGKTTTSYMLAHIFLDHDLKIYALTYMKLLSFHAFQILQKHFYFLIPFLTFQVQKHMVIFDLKFLLHTHFPSIKHYQLHKDQLQGEIFFHSLQLF